MLEASPDEPIGRTEEQLLAANGPVSRRGPSRRHIHVEVGQADRRGALVHPPLRVRNPAAHGEHSSALQEIQDQEAELHPWALEQDRPHWN